MCFQPMIVHHVQPFTVPQFAFSVIGFLAYIFNDPQFFHFPTFRFSVALNGGQFSTDLQRNVNSSAMPTTFTDDNEPIDQHKSVSVR